MDDSPTSVEIASDVAQKRRSAVDICAAVLTHIDQIDSQLGAFLEVTQDHANKRAAQVDAEIAAGRAVGPLAGVPIAIKDSICTRFGHTTCGSQMLEDYRSPFDATVVRRIEGAGGIIVGKTNLDEFAMGSSTENSSFEPTRNPWSLDCVPGGSSGGSAVAVAAGMTPLSLGSDTGGSIRQPAAMCGVVGLKPTYGRVSRYGLVAYASSLDQIGPLARNVTDAALLLGVISGHDAADSTSVDRPVDDYVAALAEAQLEQRGKALRIGIPSEFFGDGLDGEVRATVEAALRVYDELGAELVELSMPHMPYSVAAYYLIATAECSSNLARFDGVHYGNRAARQADVIDLCSASRAAGFGAEVKRRIMLGTFALSAGYYDAYYDKASRVRRLIQQDFDQAFSKVDLIASPTTPTCAFQFGEKTDDPLQMYLADVYTIAANLAGVPGISIPCGFSADGLPIGLQLYAPAFGETALLQAARLYEQRTPWHKQRVPEVV